MSRQSKTKSSRRWLKEHFDDPYVKQAQKGGFRSRAVFKLLEIQEKDQILKPGALVIDLGAAPGGWAQVAAQAVGHKGRVLALDILPMEPLPGVEFIQGDFAETTVFDELLLRVKDHRVGLVMSDMAPNITGLKAVDQPRAMYMVELAYELAQNVLGKNRNNGKGNEGGDFLVKVFQGAGFDELLRSMRQQFGKVVSRKPKASRPRSREIYLLARGYKGAK